MDTPRTERKAQQRNSRLTTLDEWFDQAFEWMSENAQWTLGVLGVVIVGAGIAAGIHEFGASRENAAQAALADVDRELEAAFGPGAEPANPDTAKGIREKALGGYETVAREREGTFGGSLAVIRAATTEIDLGRFDAAEKRLAEAASSWPKNSLKRAVALRLHGYTLERLERPQEAAEAYAQAAAIVDYPGRAGAYAQAGDTFARIGANERAISMYEALIQIDAGFSERMGVLERLEGLRSASSSAAPKGAAPAGATAPPKDAAPAGSSAPAKDAVPAGATAAPAKDGAPAGATAPPGEPAAPKTPSAPGT